MTSSSTVESSSSSTLVMVTHTSILVHDLNAICHKGEYSLAICANARCYRCERAFASALRLADPGVTYASRH